MAQESYAYYRAFGERFDPCGYLFLAYEEETLARLEAGLAVQHELGIPSRLLTPAAAADVVPGFEPARMLGAAWCAEDGYFARPQAVVEAFAEQVGAGGGQIELNGVRGILRGGAGWRLDLGGRSSIRSTRGSGLPPASAAVEAQII
jgi:sarcosine oxidase, subunit beta